MLSVDSFRICAFLLVFSVSLKQIAARRTACGPALDNALSTICENGFNTKFKKSMDWDDRGLNDLVEELPFPYGNSPFLAKVHGGHFNTIAKSRLRRDGVYDECCSRGCTYNEIFSYCNPEGEFKKEDWRK